MKRRNAPRLANGESRVPAYNRLPPYVKEALRTIARMERKSMSWVIEEVVIDYFSMRRPRYQKPRSTRSRR